jgi:hypothetical protein
MLALALPGIAAAAHDGRRHHHAHHAGTHARPLSKHARAILPAAAPGGGQTDTPPSPPAPPTPPSGEPAGTVVSFEGGKLTIELSDKTKLAGQVTEETEIHCPPPANGGQGQGDEGHGSEESQGGGHEGHSGDQACTTTALVAGAKVLRAELSLTGAGPVWEKVDLMKP